jgi:heme-degrading monooxygenase HmoA
VSGELLVLIWQTAGAAETEALEETYREVSKEMAGTPGLLGNKLIQSAINADNYAVLAHWKDMGSFQKWYQTADHKTTEPMRRYRDPNRTGPQFDIFRVVSEF